MTTGMQIYDGSAAGIVMPDVVNLPSMASVGEFLKVGAGNVLEYGAGGVAIGDVVTNGNANSVLFVDGSGDLGQDANFCWSTSSQHLLIGDQTFAGNYQQIRAVSILINTVDSNAAIDLDSFGAGNQSYVAMESEMDDGFVRVKTGAFNWSFGVDASDTAAFVISQGNTLGFNALRIDSGTLEITIPALAGVGSRPVVVDANGKLSA